MGMREPRGACGARKTHDSCQIMDDNLEGLHVKCDGKGLGVHSQVTVPVSLTGAPFFGERNPFMSSSGPTLRTAALRYTPLRNMLWSYDRPALNLACTTRKSKIEIRQERRLDALSSSDVSRRLLFPDLRGRHVNRASSIAIT